MNNYNNDVFTNVINIWKQSAFNISTHLNYKEELLLCLSSYHIRWETGITPSQWLIRTGYCRWFHTLYNKIWENLILCEGNLIIQHWVQNILAPSNFWVSVCACGFGICFIDPEWLTSKIPETTEIDTLFSKTQQIRKNIIFFFLELSVVKYHWYNSHRTRDLFNLEKI